MADDNTSSPLPRPLPKVPLQVKDLWMVIGLLTLLCCVLIGAHPSRFEKEVWEQWDEILPLLFNQTLVDEQVRSFYLTFHHFKGMCFVLRSNDHFNTTEGANFTKGLYLWTISGQFHQVIYSCVITPTNETSFYFSMNETDDSNKTKF